MTDYVPATMLMNNLKNNIIPDNIPKIIKNILIKKQYLINSINNEEKENLIIKTSKLPIVILNFSKEIIE